jgi:putative spermidine/putrescine transport system substrate-binding protein
MRNLRIPAALSVAALVLAACASESPQPSGYITELPAAEDELNLVIWVGYAEDGSNDPAYDWVTPFEEETGCQVTTTDGLDSANMVSLMATGQYDGVSASGDATLRMIAAGTVAPVNLDLIPNYADVFEGLKGQPHNTVDGVAYGVPHGRGANVLLYNTEVFAAAPTSWDVVWEDAAEHSGQISIWAYQNYIADAALHLMTKNPDLGITDPYQLNQEQFDAAIALLEAQNDHVGQYWGAAQEQIDAFAAGDMVVGTSWQYQYNTLIGSDAPVGVTLPAEGSTGWSDTWMISSEAAHPGCMYRWMNWMLKPEISAMATVWFGEAPTSEAACEAAEALSPGHCDTFHADDEAYFDKIWFWSTPQTDCADSDPATTCKNIDEWTEAWTGITGG